MLQNASRRCVAPVRIRHAFSASAPLNVPEVHTSMCTHATGDRDVSNDPAELSRQIEEVVKQQAELRREMSRLVEQSQVVGSQLEILSKAMAAQSSHNLLRVYSLESKSCQTTGHARRRREFRPTVNEIIDQPNHVSQLGNLPLFELASQGSHSAQKERLIRDIMQVDGVTWEAAHDKLNEMDAHNEERYWRQTMPYRIGILGAVVGAVAGSAMVFWRPVAEWYGTSIAGESLPDGVEDVSSMTVNQVGTWTWGWMEPMIGTASFVILCSQVARGQMWKLNMRPYTEFMQRARAERLAGRYPEYDKGMVRAWAKHVPMVNWKTMPSFRRHLGWRAL